MTQKKILLVDDSSFSRAMLKKIIKEIDFLEVIAEAANGEEAVEKYKEYSPDLVTMDIIMPVLGGIDATREILKIDPKAAILIVSTINEETLGHDVPKEVRGFIRKPFKADTVTSVLNDLFKD